jgi:hypothetical protein
MTVFIPEWSRSVGAQRPIKRVFNTLDDSYVIRKCVNSLTWTPDFFLQQPNDRWLAIVLCETPFEALDPGQLFDSTEREDFLKLLSHLQGITAAGQPKGQSIGKLVLMWNCDAEQTKRLWTHYSSPMGPRLMSKKTFTENGTETLPRMLNALSHEASQNVLGHFFPEAEIPGICTTRRNFTRDNSAKTVRFFLDTQQEWASKLDLELPGEQTETTSDFSVRLVNGVAGSGKTLIAANRALILAKMFPDQQVLMLIHNVPVVADLKHRLQRAHGEIPKNLTICTALTWIRKQWVNLYGLSPTMAGRAKVLGHIQRFRQKHPELKPVDEQLLDEFDFINETLVVDEEQYLALDRAGQGFALRKEERAQVWSLYETINDALNKNQLRLWSSLPRDLCLANRSDKLDRYNHILVDEAQFFAPSWFQLVKRTLENSEASLFLCADPNQGFLKNRLSWKRVGLDVAGKTKKLRKSYRTTQAILRAANQVLAEFTQTDPEDFLQPDFEGMETGTPPILISSATPQDAVAQTCNEIAAHMETLGVGLSNILVIHGWDVDKQLLINSLDKRFGKQKVWDLNAKDFVHQDPEVLRISSLDTATGLEANVVFLVGMEKLLQSTAQTEVISENELEQRARKLYMAMTRAGQRLILISSKQLPPKIAQLFVQAKDVAAVD